MEVERGKGTSGGGEGEGDEWRWRGRKGTRGIGGEARVGGRVEWVQGGHVECLAISACCLSLRNSL